MAHAENNPNSPTDISVSCHGALITGGCKKHPTTSKSPSTASDLKMPKSRPTLADVREAAGKGDAAAQLQLAMAYASGGGVPKDEAESLKWLRKSAEQGYAEAQVNLAGCYEKGVMVPEDAVEAVKWFRKSADHLYDGAQYSLGQCYAEGRGVPKDNVTASMWFYVAAEWGHEKAKEDLKTISLTMTPAEVLKAQQLGKEWMVSRNQ